MKPEATLLLQRCVASVAFRTPAKMDGTSVSTLETDSGKRKRARRGRGRPTALIAIRCGTAQVRCFQLSGLSTDAETGQGCMYPPQNPGLSPVWRDQFSLRA